MEKTILRAFDNLPGIQSPDNLKSDKKIYELRIYESPGLSAAKKKIQMFNEGGELQIFKSSGLQPIFFGETIAGRNMPNLQYLLAFESIETREINWTKFENNPDWIKLKSEPEYADLISRITDIILKPASFSQI